MSKNDELPDVPWYIRVMACVSRTQSKFGDEPWPMKAMANDHRDDSFTGEQDNGRSAAVENTEPKGGGKRLVLVSRPVGDIKKSDFRCEEKPVPEPEAGEVLLKTLYVSIDPTHRLWVSAQPQYMPAVGLGCVMRAATIGKVVKSESSKAKVGTFWFAMGGIQEYACLKDRDLYPLMDGVPLPLNFSLFSIAAGVTAWVGTNICETKPGQTIVVSAAGGSVGQIACQLAKARGMKVYGLAGAESKIKWLKDVAGLDGVINYKTDDLSEAIDKLCPNGVDAYLDNVGGKTLETMFSKMNRFGRIAYCGHISGYNSDKDEPVSVNNYQMILMRRLKVQGFICTDHIPDIMQCFGELLNLYLEGKMKVQEHIDESGMENYTEVVNMLYKGTNQGKLMMKIADE